MSYMLFDTVVKLKCPTHPTHGPEVWHVMKIFHTVSHTRVIQRSLNI